MDPLLNFILKGTLIENEYHPGPGRRSSKFPKRDNPAQHGELLQKQYALAIENARRTYTGEQVAAIKAKDGCYLDISSLTGKDLDIKSLEDRRIGIRLCNVRENKIDGNLETTATIFIPNAAEKKFLSKIQKYTDGIQNGKNNPANNDLVRSIEKISMAVVLSLWTDRTELFPHNKTWCEIWLQSNANNREEICNSFFNLCEQLGILTKPEVISFPERSVLLVFSNEEDLRNILTFCDSLSELRKAPEPNTFFIDLVPCEQRAWAQDLLERLKLDYADTSVCLLDTGLNDGHPLLKPLVLQNGILKVKDQMKTAADQDGHGTGMAGIVAYGDLQDCLESKNEVVIHHQIESVKLLDKDSPNKQELYGEYTKQAIAQAEINNSEINRSFCMAITANQTGKIPGRPSAWSAAIDEESAGVNADGFKRLILVSAGDVQPSEYNLQQLGYPNSCIMHSVEDPAQAWNALTVGAYTSKIDISEDDFKNWEPVAEPQALSPFSTTSVQWGRKWPIKPEILCEGGNLAKNGRDYDTPDSLQVLTTNYHPQLRLFTSTNATSAATAYASWMTAQLMH